MYPYILPHEPMLDTVRDYMVQCQIPLLEPLDPWDLTLADLEDEYHPIWTHPKEPLTDALKCVLLAAIKPKDIREIGRPFCLSLAALAGAGRISRYKRQYGTEWLSNFASEVRPLYLSEEFKTLGIEPDPDHLRYWSVEAAYQAATTDDMDLRSKIAACAYASDAKKLGWKIKTRKEWDDLRLPVMSTLHIQKWTERAEQLLGTDRKVLVEGNERKDYYWGVCNERGADMLGIIQMGMRGQLRRPSAR